MTQSPDLLAVLREAREVLMLSDPDFHERDLTHPKRGFDAAVRALCEAHGYGAVMQSASNQWRLKDSVGAHTRGACVLTVQQTIARIDSALRALTESAEAPVAWIPKCDLDEIAKGFVGRAFRDGSDNCAPVYTHPAPHPAVAGVTWEQASKADRIYWEHRDNGAIAEDAMRAALEAALGAREGK